MARLDTSSGFENYPIPLASYAAGTEQALIAPTASGVYPSLPSPAFPLSTVTYPCVLYVTPSPDIAGSVYDGHPFSIRLSAKFTTAASVNTSILVNLYHATNAVLAGGPTAAAYSVVTALTGTGVTKLVTGTSTAANSVSGMFTFEGAYIWDSVSKQLGIANVGTTWQKGSTVSTTQTTAVVGSLSNVNDLNFYPSFTFATTVPTAFTVTEFVINRI
jgi:hypothetical protein